MVQVSLPHPHNLAHLVQRLGYAVLLRLTSSKAFPSTPGSFTTW